MSDRKNTKERMPKKTKIHYVEITWIWNASTRKWRKGCDRISMIVLGDFSKFNMLFPYSHFYHFWQRSNITEALSLIEWKMTIFGGACSLEKTTLT